LCFLDPGSGTGFGTPAAGIGDVDGDGFSDLGIVSYHGSSAVQVYVYLGGTNPDNSADIVLNGPPIATTVSSLIADISAAGDLNADGFSDIILGQYSNVTNEPEDGATGVYYGGSSISGQADVVLTGSYRVSGVGDVNGDGQREVAVGAFLNSAVAPNAGRAYVISVSSHPQSVEVAFSPSTIEIASNGRWVNACIEPHTFGVSSIEVSSVRVEGDVSADPKFGHEADHDGDGWKDLMVKFDRQALSRHLTTGLNTLRVSGSIAGGGDFEGSATIYALDRSTGQLTASVTPNPLNPAGRLMFSTPLPGPVRVRVFDTAGRLVQTAVDSPFMPAGLHEVTLSSRSLHGTELGSGVYFYQIDSTDKHQTGRFTVLK
jgi:hypothetical protein